MSTSRIILNASRPAARRSLPRPQAYRKYATEAHQAPANSSHLVSGLVGGAVALGGVYAYYQYSGAAKVVSTARSLTDSASQAGDKLKDSIPSTQEALKLAKSLAKSYAAAIPGAATIIDQGFDQLESFLNTHGEKAGEIIQSTYADLQKAVKDGKGGADQILKVLQEAAGKVQELVGEEAGKGWEKLGEKYPELKKALGGEGDELKKLTEKHGPEAKQIATDFYSQAAKIVTAGGFNAETYESVKKLLEQKKDELAKFSQKAGSDAWSASSKAAGPLLDKMPEVKQVVDDNLSKVQGYVGEDRVKIVKDLYSELTKIGESDKSIEDKTKAAKKLVEDKLGSTSEFASLGLGKAKDLAGEGKKWLDGLVPGLGGMSKCLLQEGGTLHCGRSRVMRSPKSRAEGFTCVLLTHQVFEDVDLGALKELAHKRGQDAEKLLNSTYDEIKEVLKKKADEAKKLGAEVKEEGKKEAKSDGSSKKGDGKKEEKKEEKKDDSKK
ncbi:SPOSA6832_04035 [Sporobolomyces salmonicolor]|uniref:SPOSA6832_04035-mRNA-1:cds n=1 Tax=Sporidiobolus salmonicolor TaxID=5005 RepID=A0A0D6EQI6_SPOSA|nr:SPOSA6832_04035 [Sporobolomyces salmonicolor]